MSHTVLELSMQVKLCQLHSDELQWGRHIVCANQVVKLTQKGLLHQVVHMFGIPHT